MLAGEEAPGEEVLKQISISRAVLIQGLGDGPLRLCLCVKYNPYKIWNRLKDRYAVSNTATRVQIQTKFSRMSYKGQSLQDYVDSYEEIFNHIAAMNSKVADDVQVAMLLASFGDKNRSTFGIAIASLQSMQESFDWETATAVLLQEYNDQLLIDRGASKTPKVAEEASALTASGSGCFQTQWKNKPCPRQETRRCFACGKVGHIARNCLTKDGKKRKLSFADAVGRQRDADMSMAQNAQLLMAHGDDTTEDDKWEDSPEDSVEDLHQVAIAQKAVSGSKKKSSNVFLLDSGISDHMVWSRDWLENVEEIEPRAVILGDGTRGFATCRRTLMLRTVLEASDDRYEGSVIHHKVLFVLGLHANLISCCKLCENGYVINMGGNRCNGMLDRVTQFQRLKFQGVYRVIAHLTSPWSISAKNAVLTVVAIRMMMKMGIPILPERIRCIHSINDLVMLTLVVSESVLGPVLYLDGALAHTIVSRILA